MVGLLHKTKGDLTEAYAAFKHAISLVAHMRGSLLQPQHRSGVLERSLLAYQHIVDTGVELHRYAEAFEYVEKAKSDRIVELLASRDLRPKQFVPANLIHEYENLQGKLKSVTQTLRPWQETRPTHPMTRQLKAELEEVEKQFDRVVTKIKAIDPDFVATIKTELVRYSEAQADVRDEESAIIEFFMTETRTLAFVILKSGEPLPPVTLPDLAPSDTSDLVNTWLQAYAAFRNNPATGWQHWRDTMDFTLTAL